MSNLERLQDWYKSQCDGDWEHTYGVSVTTLDNPGWLVTVDLTGTAVETTPFAVVERADSQRDADWIVCKREGARFVGAGGAENLGEILTIFLGWIDKSRPPDANARAV